MNGNVAEWVQDYYRSSYQGLAMDGSANESNADSKYRALRGGSWLHASPFTRSASRFGWEPFVRLDSLGFRLVARLK